jgi:hypothetical protein
MLVNICSSALILNVKKIMKLARRRRRRRRKRRKTLNYFNSLK